MVNVVGRQRCDEPSNVLDGVFARSLLRVVHVLERLVAVALAQPATVRLVNRSVRSPIPQEAVDHEVTGR